MMASRQRMLEEVNRIKAQLYEMDNHFCFAGNAEYMVLVNRMVELLDMVAGIKPMEGE